MASKRHQRRRACRSKVGYSDRAAATQAMMKTVHINRTKDCQVIREIGCSMRVYACGSCGLYHFGHFRLPDLSSAA